MRMLRFSLALCLLVPLTSIPLLAQSTGTLSTVTGTVFDKTGAAVPKAQVELRDIATNDSHTTTSGDVGQYTFAGIKPGTYTVTVTAGGFRKAVVGNVKVEVGKSAQVNVTLEVGTVSEVVEVQATTGAELQTLDASVGNVLDENLLKSLPNLTRDATSLLMLQPTAIPGFNGPGGTGESNLSVGVAGARSDQNTFVIDGGDATSNTEASGGYNSGFIGTPRAVVPTPIESLEEFRLQTNNPNATFTRSAGAAVQMVTKRGTNNWHGAAYWYLQNDELNANDWFRNINGKENPELRDNRLGGLLGGPIWKDRTFFFMHFEGRHFFKPAVFTRRVPTDALRAGIIEFKDSITGAINAVNLLNVPVVDPGAFPGDPLTGTTIAPNTGCGGAGTSACDPRAAGLDTTAINPAIAAEWNLVPRANDFTQFDNLRSAAFTSTSPETINEEFAVVRLDHKINSKWDFTGSFRYAVTDRVPPLVQVDIGGITSGAKLGVPAPVAKRPLQPRYFVVGLTGRITNNLTNEFHFDWLRHWWQWGNVSAHPVISNTLTDAALQIWQESRTSGMVPINVDTQNARQRLWNGKDYTFIDNVSWLKGKHLWTFGGRSQLQHFLHVRDDKVVGGLIQPIYYAVRGGDFTNIGIGSTFRPPGLNPLDKTSYRRAYISALGLIDTASQVLTRAGDLTPNPPFTTIQQHTVFDSYELHFSDTYRVLPSLTVTYGLTWGVEMPPFEQTGKQTMMVDASSGQIISTLQLYNARRLAGLNGQVVNPVLAFVPIRSTGRKYPYDPDYTNFGPRLAAAWNPSFTNGWLNKIFGDRKTVIRAGWSRAFDRLNGVGIVMTPALGVGFGDVSTCKGPNTSGICTGGTNPNTAFRIGVDGNHISIPPLPTVTGAVIPGIGGTIPIPATQPQPNSVFENRDFRIDPRRQTGGTDMLDFSIQRELPWQMLLEVGYVGRISRDLFQQSDVNHVPYMFTAGGQTFAQAFDNVAAGSTSEPWFENMLGPGGTMTAINSPCTDFGDHAVGLTFFCLEPSFVTTGQSAGQPLTGFNRQVAGMDMTTSLGYANYHALFLSLRKRASHGLVFDFNYTFSKSLDIIGLTQENTDAIADPYFPSRAYAPSLFDRRHTFNLLANYELPLGKGKPFASSSGVLDKLIGGWSVSGIYTAASGLPLFAWDDSGCGTEFGSTAFNGDDTGLIPIKPGVIHASRHNNPTISGSFGSSSLITLPNGQPGIVPNAFADPAAVAANFRQPTFADQRLGFGSIRGLFRWNVDLSVAKTTQITERVRARFDVQFINAFNHPMFQSVSQFYAFEPNTDVADPTTFGVMSSQFNSPRFIQFGLKVEF